MPPLTDYKVHAMALICPLKALTACLKYIPTYSWVLWATRMSPPFFFVKLRTCLGYRSFLSRSCKLSTPLILSPTGLKFSSTVMIDPTEMVKSEPRCGDQPPASPCSHHPSQPVSLSISSYSYIRAYSLETKAKLPLTLSP